MNQWYLYIVRCNDDTLYTGITKDIDDRINIHNSSKGAKYTRSRLPVELIYSEEHESESSVRKREMEIKSWTREKKIELIKNYSA
jgi:predicted GIY-YIG superfamily endonuclease